MFRKSARLGLEIVGSLLAGILLVVAFGLWRLSWEEPLRVSFLTPYIEQALQSPQLAYSVDVGDTVMTWKGWGNRINIVATDVAAVDEQGVDVAHVPQIDFQFSVRALLRGLIAPISIDVHQPSIVLRRHGDGHISLGRMEERTQQPVGESILFPALFDELVDEPDPSRPTGYLSEASIVEAEVEFIDDQTGLTWRPENTTVVLRRGDAGLTGSISLDIPELGRPAVLTADLVYDPAAERIGIDGTFGTVDLATLGRLHAKLMRFANAELVLDGTVKLDVGLDGSIGRIDVTMKSGAGRIELPRFYDEPLEIAGGEMVGHVAAGFDGVTIDSLVLDLTDGPQIRMNGGIDGLNGGPASLAVDVIAENVDFATLSRFWPNGVGTDARAWMTENVPVGLAPTAQAVVRMRWPTGFDGEQIVDTAEGTVDATGLTVIYVDTLPPITDANGHGVYKDGSFDIDIHSGHVGDIQIAQGHVTISGIDGAEQWLSVNGTVEAPLGAALELLDHPRLGYVSNMGIDRTDAGGSATADLHFEFPARKGLALENVDITAQAVLTDASLRSVALDQPLEAGNFDLDFTMAGMTMTGAGTFGGVPLDVRWLENFGEIPLERQIEVTGRATTGQIAEVIVDVEPRIVGPVGMDIVYSDFDDGRSEVAAKLDLLDATVELEEVAYRKTSGEAGSAMFALTMLDNVPQQMRDIYVTGPSLDGDSGAANFDPETGEIRNITMSALTIGDSVLTDVLVAFAGPRTDIVLGGGTLDAAPFMSEEVEEQPAEEPGGPEEAPDPDIPEPGLVPEAEPAPLDPEEYTPPFTLQAEHLDRVLLGSDRVLRDARLKLHVENDYWEWIEVAGQLGTDESAGDNAVTIRYVPTVEGTHELAVEAADAGATLAAFGLTTSIVGGKLTVTGVSNDSEPLRPLRGNLYISEFRLVNAPNLARLLSIATLTGLLDVLTGEGFLFTGLRLGFEKTGGHVAIMNGRAHGPSLGITADGWIDIDDDRISLEGTLVPAYAFNSILGNIPIIGTLLQGGKGEGLFAATYSATGRLSEPDFSYNPLAALAPGFLREMFEAAEPGNAPPEGGAPGESEDTAPAEPFEHPKQPDR